MFIHNPTKEKSPMYRMRATIKLPANSHTPALTAAQEREIVKILKEIPKYLKRDFPADWPHLDDEISSVVDIYPVPD